MIKKLATAAALTAIMVSAGSAMAADHTIKMLNRGSDGQFMVFEPAYVEVMPGDTVTFVPTDPGHNAETVLNMSPEGGETFKGKFNQEVSFTPTKEGVYGVKCMPHYALGMVALIKVGDGEAPNLGVAAAVKQPGKAKDRMADLFDRIAAE